MNNYFEQILWQDKAIELLQSELSSKTESHAYLFAGPKGCGKSEAAFALATSLIRRDFGSLSESDFNDQIVLKLNNNAFADLTRLYPSGASTYLIDQIRRIVSDANLRPNLSNHKIYIIEQAERLGISSANALLKTLEEPPSYVNFILLADDISNVLPTIVSRCQTILFNNLPWDKSIQYVQNQAGCAFKDAELALNLYGGDTRAAIDFCVDQDYLDLHDESSHIVSNIKKMTDWQILQRSKDIVAKIDEICDAYKLRLDDQSSELMDNLDKSRHAEELKIQKRQLSKRRTELLTLVVQSAKYEFLKMLKQDNKLLKNNQRYALCVIDNIQNTEQILRYNINPQIFCDALFIGIKETSIKWQ